MNYIIAFNVFRKYCALNKVNLNECSKKLKENFNSVNILFVNNKISNFNEFE